MIPGEATNPIRIAMQRSRLVIGDGGKRITLLLEQN